jgi:hypothetical protein
MIGRQIGSDRCAWLRRNEVRLEDIADSPR